MLLVSCGGIKLGLDDEARELVEEITGNDDEGSDGESTTASDSDSDSDTTGGIEPQEREDNNTPRYFMGTYEWISSAYINGVSLARCTHGFMNVTRLYSHNDIIDFERSNGELVWIADVYEDDTFDFTVNFLDSFGDMSISVECTCILDEPYYDYYNERVICTCDPSDGSSACGVAYEQMGE